MNKLIQDLLDVAKIEAGKISLEMGFEEMGELATEAVQQAEWLARKKGVDLSFKGFGSEPLLANVDRNKILQVMSNLIENGVNFTPEGGTVTFSVRKKGTDVSVAVSDNGMGIEPQVVDNLFDRFWQGHRKDGKGSGLGLTIVKGILETHATVVKVETELGEGSSFEFSLPLVD